MDEGDDAQIARSRQVALQVLWTVVALAIIALPPVSIWVAAIQAERLLGLDPSAELGALSASVAVSMLWPLQGAIWLAWVSGFRIPGLIAGVALVLLRLVTILVLGFQAGLPGGFVFLLIVWCVNVVLDGLGVWGGTLIGASRALRGSTWTVEGASKTGAWVGSGALLLGGCWFVHWLLIDAAFSPRADPEQPVAFLEILPFFLILADWVVVPLAVMAPVVFARERVAIPQAVVSALVITTWVGGWSFALQGTLAGVLWTFVVLALVQVCTTLLVIPAAYASWSMRGLAALATASADRPGEAPGS